MTREVELEPGWLERDARNAAKRAGDWTRNRTCTCSPEDVHNNGPCDENCRSLIVAYSNKE